MKMRFCALIFLMSLLSNSQIKGDVQEIPSGITQEFKGFCQKIKNLCATIHISHWGYKNPITGKITIGASIGLPSGEPPVHQAARAWCCEQYQTIKQILNHISETAACTTTTLLSKLNNFIIKHPVISSLLVAQTVILIALATKINSTSKHQSRENPFYSNDDHDTDDELWQTETY